MSSQNTQNKVGFLTIYQKTTESYVGGLLTTDIKTRPLDLRVTTSIKPTALQKLMYGKLMKGHIYIEIISKQLLETLGNEQLEILFVDDEILLDLRPSCSFPVCAVLSDAKTANNGEQI